MRRRNDDSVWKCLKCGYTEPTSGKLRFCPQDGSLLVRTRPQALATSTKASISDDPFEQFWVTLREKLRTAQTFPTIGEHTTFTARYLPPGTILVTPSSTERPRPITKAHLRQVYQRWIQRKSYNPADYADMTVNSVYVLRLFKTFLADAKSASSSQITSEWILHYLTRAKQDREYYPEYQLILEELQGKPYFTKPQLVRIAKWKLKSFERFKKAALVEQNTAQQVVDTTRAAFQAATDEDRIRQLTKLSGLRIPMASTILTFQDPTRFAIFDKHAWTTLWDFQLVDTRRFKRDYGTTPPSYAYYDAFIRVVRAIAAQHDLTPREVELALFTYSRLAK